VLGCLLPRSPRMTERNSAAADSVRACTVHLVDRRSTASCPCLRSEVEVHHDRGASTAASRRGADCLGLSGPAVPATAILPVMAAPPSSPRPEPSEADIGVDSIQPLPLREPISGSAGDPGRAKSLAAHYLDRLQFLKASALAAAGSLWAWHSRRVHAPPRGDFAPNARIRVHPRPPRPPSAQQRDLARMSQTSLTMLWPKSWRSTRPRRWPWKSGAARPACCQQARWSLRSPAAAPRSATRGSRAQGGATARTISVSAAARMESALGRVPRIQWPGHSRPAERAYCRARNRAAHAPCGLKK